VKASWEKRDLSLRHPFTIARGSRTTSPSVILRLEHDGTTGIGEAAPSSRYDETVETVDQFLASLPWQRFHDAFLLEEICSTVVSHAPGNNAAKAAVDLALHDWLGNRLGQPLWRILGLNPAKAPVTSFTIGIDTPEAVRKKVAEAEEFPVLKVKVGIPDDEMIIQAIRDCTDKPIRADANEGWTDKSLALDKICQFAEMGVELVEQPMPANRLDDMVWLRERVPVPLFADESVRSGADLKRLSGSFHGINIKLMKCGGIREALRMIHTARSLGLSVMLGCMIETSVGISGAAQLAPLADYCDLDGNILITNDPYTGVLSGRGKLVFSDRPGLGLLDRNG
jgi:L-Ala-D/L-Glu epimerase